MSDELALMYDDLYAIMLNEFADVPDDSEIDIRDFAPYPDRIPDEVETRMTMGEFRRRIRSVRGTL